MQAHPSDVVVDRCTLCGRGEENGATDWIACDGCNSWVHFSCDKRPGLGTFDDYDNADQPRSYTCPNCARSAARLAQKGTGGGAAAAAAAGGSGLKLEGTEGQQQQQQQEAQPMET
jgi:DNA-directed RNA polymerase subunit RPC12/RpoP